MNNDVVRLGSIFGHMGGCFAGLVYNPKGISPAIKQHKVD